MKKFLKRKYKKSSFSNAGINSGILKRIFLASKGYDATSIISYGDTLAKIDLNDLLKKHSDFISGYFSGFLLKIFLT